MWLLLGIKMKELFQLLCAYLPRAPQKCKDPFSWAFKRASKDYERLCDFFGHVQRNRETWLASNETEIYCVRCGKVWHETAQEWRVK